MSKKLSTVNALHPLDAKVTETEEKVFAGAECLICMGQGETPTANLICAGCFQFDVHFGCFVGWTETTGECPACGFTLFIAEEVVAADEQKVIPPMRRGEYDFRFGPRLSIAEEVVAADEQKVIPPMRRGKYDFRFGSKLELDCMQKLGGRNAVCFCKRPLYQISSLASNGSRTYGEIFLCLKEKCGATYAKRHIKLAMKEWILEEFGSQMPDDLWDTTLDYLFEGTMESAYMWINSIPKRTKQRKSGSAIKTKKMRRSITLEDGTKKWINIPEYDGYRRKVGRGSTNLVKRSNGGA